MADKMLHYDLAKMSIAAYESCSYCSGGVEVLHEIKDDTHYFAIRGTEASTFFSGRGFLDVLRDLRIWPRNIGDTKGHAGFVQGYKEIESFIMTTIAVDYKPIVLTGHSMGGAIALIAGYSLQKDIGGRLRSVVTFGAPRCLKIGTIDRDVLLNLHSKTTQYQHVRDKVPGFLAYSYYQHLDITFLPYKFRNGKRAGWFARDWQYHRMSVYRDILGQAAGVIEKDPQQS